MSRLYLLSIFVISFVSNAYSSSCCHVDKINMPQCVVENFNIYYRNNYSMLWDYLNSTSQSMLKSNSAKQVSEFLVVVNAGTGNIEYTEFIHEFIENIAIKNTKVFFDALLIADKKTVFVIFKILDKPIFYSKAELSRVLNNYLKIEKYSPLSKYLTTGKNKIKGSDSN